MKQVSPEELKQWIDAKKDIILLDVREQWEYDIVNIPGAICSPLGLLQSNPAEIAALDKTKPVLVYCHHGRRSMMGCNILESLGFTDLSNLTGGIDHYADKVDPTMEKY